MFKITGSKIILVLVFTFIVCQYPLRAQFTRADTLRLELLKDQSDSDRIVTLNSLGWELRANPDTALIFGRQAYALAEKINWKKGMAPSLGNIGVYYYRKTDYINALDYLNKALKIDEELNNKEGMSKHLGNIGLVYYNQGDYPKTLDYYFNALTLREALGKKKLIASSLGNIGLVYYELEDYSKALDYYFKALKMAEESGHNEAMVNNMGNIGNAYFALHDKPKALYYYSVALKKAEEFGNKKSQANNLGNIANIYKEQADYKKALDFGLRGLRLKEEFSNKKDIAISLINIGELYALDTSLPPPVGENEKGYLLAEKYFYQALAIDNSIGALDELKDDYGTLSELYNKSDVPLHDSVGGKLLNMEEMRMKALYFYKRFIALRDTLFSAENKQQLVRREMNFEFDKKETIAKAEQEKKDVVTRITLYSVSAGMLLVLVLAVFIFRGYKQKQRSNLLLEDKNKIIQEKNKDITDSINYAKRIQQAKLPKMEEILASLPQCFVLFKPKDIVSGDFYFFHKSKDRVFIAAADCTGHGVPGALMSMIGSEKLEDAVSQSADTSEILRLLNIGVKTSLRQSNSDESTRDGMDIALCSVEVKNRIVKYSGANRPLWIVRKDAKQVEEHKATKTAIAGFTSDDQHFATHELELQQDDTFYIFSDGYADTFNGADGKKLMTKKLKEILLGSQHKTMQQQEQHLNDFVENWKGGTEQVDDILVIGVRL